MVAPALEELQGGLFLRSGQRERGEAVLKGLAARVRALPGPDNWVRALFTLESIARMARDAGDWPLAQWAAAQMIAHDPNYAGGHYAAALVAVQGGELDEARRQFALAQRFWSGADPMLPELVRARQPRP
jgi:hypothetical protein